MRPGTIMVIIFGLLMLIYITLKWADRRERIGRVEQVVQAGEALYDDHCSACHGVGLLNASGAPDLLLFQRDHVAFANAVLNGFYPMPAYEGVLTGGEVSAIWAYVAHRKRAEGVD